MFVMLLLMLFIVTKDFPKIDRLLIYKFSFHSPTPIEQNPAQQIFAYEVIGLTYSKQSIKLASHYIYELLSQECTSIFVLIKIWRINKKRYSIFITSFLFLPVGIVQINRGLSSLCSTDKY